MENKQQRRLGPMEHGVPPPSGDVETDFKDEARKHKAHQKAITRGLRTFFDSVASEPVPDEFMSLLRKMDESGHE